MMADPAFLQKLAMEQAITISSSLWWEAQQRGDRFSKVCHLSAIWHTRTKVPVHVLQSHI